MSVRPGWPAGVSRLILDSVDSTNAYALRAAPADPTWILALHQTAGRGRRGRAWSMPAGNLAATFTFCPSQPPAEVARLSFVAALALADTLADAGVPARAVTLKWPNDVLLNGHKVAGILLESAGTSGQVARLAIGFGVNLAAAPDPATLPADALLPTAVAPQTGLLLTPPEFLDLLAPAFARWQARLAAEGFGCVRDAWLARAARLGQPICARTGTSETHGIFDGIDLTGALVMTTAAGRQTIPAADVYFQG